jgi:hypothetical protein
MATLFPFYSYMRILQVYQEKMATKHIQVSLAGISLRGIRVISLLRLPINENIIWGFQLEDRAGAHTAKVCITACRETEQGYEYEAEWIQEEMNPAHARAIQSYTGIYEGLSANNQIDILC